LQRDQFRAVQNFAERSIENVIAERLTEVADDHRVAPVLGLLQLGEVALDLVVHDQRDALSVALDTVSNRERRRGDQLSVSDRESEPIQLVEGSLS
jgi:hypothetical protein